MKHRLVFIMIFLFLFTLFGCRSETIQSNSLEDYLITSEKSLPDNFYLVATESDEIPNFSYVFHKASSTEELEQLWGNYKINKAIPKIEFAESDVYFLGLEESSSCPYKIEQIEVGIKNMSIDLFSYEGDCTADASPRTFVIKLDKNSSNSLEKIELTIANEQTLLLLTSIK